MKNLSKLTMAAAFFLTAFMTSNVAKAQVKPAPQQQQKQVIDLSKLPATITAGIRAYDNGRQLMLKDSIQLGSVGTMDIFWTEKSGYSKVVFTDPVKYEPTPEEIKNGKFSFTVKPERTTTYKHIKYFKDNRKPITGERVIKVFDKNGKEIK